MSRVAVSRGPRLEREAGDAYEIGQMIRSYLDLAKGRAAPAAETVAKHYFPEVQPLRQRAIAADRPRRLLPAEQRHRPPPARAEYDWRLVARLQQGERVGLELECVTVVLKPQPAPLRAATLGHPPVAEQLLHGAQYSFG
jgi:hypothetical protein